MSGAARLLGIARGVTVALATPFWLRPARLHELLRGGQQHIVPAKEISTEIAVAHRSLALLARVRLPLWRNTCLFRSVAECLVRQLHGAEYRLRIGVAAGVAVHGVAAHAWVVDRCAATHATFTPLS